MKLVEALETLKNNPGPESPVLGIQLACGFTPLHFSTFLTAHLRAERPYHRIEITTGLFGDLPGTLERLEKAQNEYVAIVPEWQLGSAPGDSTAWRLESATVA